MPNYLPLLIITGFFVLFALFWCAVCAAIARLSGWATLARHYKATGAPTTGARFYGQSGAMNGIRFRTALTVGVSEEGLFLDVLFLFRPGHAPLLIPWSQISDFETEKRLFATAHTTRIRAGSGTIDLTLNDRRVTDAIRLQLQAVSPPAARSATGHRSVPD